MSKFFEYLFLVVSRTFWGADSISKTLGVVSIFVVVGFQFTDFPWEARLGLFVGLVFFGTFNVWHDERKAVVAARKQLKELRNKTPSFQVVVGEVKRFTIEPIVEKYTKIVQETQDAVDVENAREVDEDGIGGLATSILAASTAHFASMFKNLPAELRHETTEDKLERLSEYLAKLKGYEEKLKHLYKINLSLRASRSDSNIEVWVKADGVSKMIVEDDFARNNIPEVPRSRDYGMAYIPRSSIGSISLPDKLYLASEGGQNDAYSKIANLNAQRPLHLFDEDFYILTNKKSIDLEVTITSQKRNEQQNLIVVVQLENVPLETLQDNTSGD